MTPWLLYSLITLALALLFLLFLWRQNYHHSKRWLVDKIQQDNPKKDDYINRLSHLKSRHRNNVKVTVLIFIFILPTALIINHQLFPAKDNQPLQQPPTIEQALSDLKQSLQANPDDVEGQMLYARAMMSTQKFGEAVKALNKANELSPNNANILTDLAEAVAFKNETGNFLGRPEQLIDQALAANPRHQKAMWLKGIINYEKKQFAEAEKLWTELLKNIRDENVKATIVKQINQARAQQQKDPIDLTTAGLSQSKAIDQVLTTPLYQVTVEANETIQGIDFPATARVFVSAKAVSGSPMPIAAIDLAPPFQWPLNVFLSNQHNLTSNRQLSDFEQVTLSAKLSLSGDAGVSDYNSEQKTVNPSQKNITLTLSEP